MRSAHVVGANCGHPSHEVTLLDSRLNTGVYLTAGGADIELWVVGLDLLVQDVVGGDLLLQVLHAGAVHLRAQLFLSDNADRRRMSALVCTRQDRKACNQLRWCQTRAEPTCWLQESESRKSWMMTEGLYDCDNYVWHGFLSKQICVFSYNNCNTLINHLCKHPSKIKWSILNRITYLLLNKHGLPVDSGHQRHVVNLFVDVTVEAAVLQPAFVQADNTGVAGKERRKTDDNSQFGCLTPQSMMNLAN